MWNKTSILDGWLDKVAAQKREYGESWSANFAICIQYDWTSELRLVDLDLLKILDATIYEIFAIQKRDPNRLTLHFLTGQGQM